MRTTSEASPAQVQSQTMQRRHGCLFYARRGLKWGGITLVVLALLGVGYQTIATEQTKRTYSPRGQLYTVNGHQMHIVCMGEGNPTVILQSGATAYSLWWYRIQNQLATHTRVCAYDRAGLGWSEPASTPRDALSIVSELHTLLQQAGVPAPYVMAGHSFGAVWTRVFAAQYPQEVAGVVLVDSTFLPKKSDYEAWLTMNNAVQVPFWALTRTGLLRLLFSGQFVQIGYPTDIALELGALQTSNQTFDTTYAETIKGMRSLVEVSVDADQLANLPVIVLWATRSDTNQPRLAVEREETATYSSNSVTRYIEGADHGSILGNEQYAQQVSKAVLDVILASQTGKPLEQ
jgi:pimeloyl-ACP methyl ester carboxylesterase